MHVMGKESVGRFSFYKFNLPITNQKLLVPQHCRVLPKTFRLQPRSSVNADEAVHSLVPILLLAFFL